MTGLPLTARGSKSRVILLQTTGNLVLWSVIIVVIVAVGFLAVLLYLHALAWVFEHIIPWLLDAASTVSGVCVFVFLPLCIFKRTRHWAGLGFFLSSWAFAVTLIVFSCVVAFGNWGYVGLLGGLLLGGLGAIPIAFVAALTHGEWDAAGLIVIGVGLTLGARSLGTRLMRGVAPEPESRPTELTELATREEQPAASPPATSTEKIIPELRDEDMPF